MTSIDELFQQPGFPSSTKRKISDAPSSSRNHKSAKRSVGDEAVVGGRATVEDAPEEENIEYGPRGSIDDDEEADYGPQAPEDEADDDEEGRFFGGGVDKGTASALDYIDAQDATNGEEYHIEKMDKSWLRKTALNFEKKISLNAEQRAKYEDDPQKFMASEADLDESIKALSILSEHSELYEEFAKLGCAASLVGLLAHENTDVAIDAIMIVSELTDEDVIVDERQWEVLVEALLEADLLSLLTSNFDRLDENNESDRAGVYHALSVLENLASRPASSKQIVQAEKLMLWILSRIQKKEKPLAQNTQYAAEVLSILLNSQDNAPYFFDLPDTNGVDILLQLLSSYRKRDPSSSTAEEEYAEDLFDALTTVIFHKKAKSLFIDAEGVELALIMLQEGKFAKPRALRLLDHAASPARGAAEEAQKVCEKIVEAAGLKPLFGMLLKKQDSHNVEHLLGIMCALLRLLPGDSPVRIRTLAKFVEKDYQKLGKIVILRKEFAARVASADASIQKQQLNQSAEYLAEMQEDFESQRLEAGLFTLQQIDMILAWLVAEDDGAKQRIEQMLGDQGESLRVVANSLKEQLDSLGNEDQGAEDGDTSLKDMLATLIEFLA